jgi:3-hydroxyacyl-CoA dehydrogenase/enoyl-CoA hydratase/3-hydroxybutyryl-CoA epimerase
LYAYCRPYTETLRRLETCGKPFVAAVNGTALGGGLELALACHQRVLSEEPGIRLGLPEVTLGLLPGAGGTQRLPRLVGVENALPLLLEGRPISGTEALALGLVDEIAQPDALLEAARRRLLNGAVGEQPWDRPGFTVPGGAAGMKREAMQTFTAGNGRVAAKTFHNYPAPIAILSCVFEGSIVPMAAALAIETAYFASLLQDVVSRNMMRTLFVAKRKADKLLRRPAGIPQSHLRKVGVLGAGMMGAGIGWVSAEAGLDVVLLDRDAETAQGGKDRSRVLADEAVRRGRMTDGQRDEILGRIDPVVDFGELSGCDLVIEAVFEDRGIKSGVIRSAAAVIGDDVVVASNTSTLPITGLAESFSRPADFIGLHFFSPVEKMPLVEVIVGEKTSARSLAVALDYVRRIRKTPIVVADGRGFYTSRVFSTFVNEGQTMLLEGVSPPLIENAARLAGMPVGPLAVSDELSIELQYRIMAQTRADLGDAWLAPSGSRVVLDFVEKLDRRGRRFGGGFYEYPEGGRKHLWPGLAQHFPPAQKQPAVDELRKRFLYIQALEAARCMEEEIVTDAGEADLGSLLGWGFPSFTGGVLSLIDTMGIARFTEECEIFSGRLGPRFAVSDWLRRRARSGLLFHPTVERTG